MKTKTQTSDSEAFILSSMCMLYLYILILAHAHSHRTLTYTHYILNTFILIGHRNDPHPPLNCRMGGISGYYFHAFGIIVWIGLWLASKLYLFSFVWRNHLLNKSCLPHTPVYGQSSESWKSQIILWGLFSATLVLVIFVFVPWSESWLKSELKPSSELRVWEGRLTLTQTKSIFSIWIDSSLWCLVLNEPKD